MIFYFLDQIFPNFALYYCRNYKSTLAAIVKSFQNLRLTYKAKRYFKMGLDELLSYSKVLKGWVTELWVLSSPFLHTSLILVQSPIHIVTLQHNRGIKAHENWAKEKVVVTLAANITKQVPECFGRMLRLVCKNQVEARYPIQKEHFQISSCRLYLIWFLWLLAQSMNAICIPDSSMKAS